MTYNSGCKPWRQRLRPLKNESTRSFRKTKDYGIRSRIWKIDPDEIILDSWESPKQSCKRIWLIYVKKNVPPSEAITTYPSWNGHTQVGPGLTPGRGSRQVIFKYLDYTDVTNILRSLKYSNCNLELRGYNIPFFSDFSAEVVRKRKALTPECSELFHRQECFALF